ncbi:MAG: TonB-dependent receptor [Bacteroidota bacterium]|nr:TonB-dependent receptor [Bacteroidota bacterium]
MRKKITYSNFKYLGFTIFFLLSGLTGSAQSVSTVKGKITDAKQLPLPGVSVVVKNTTRGVVSDSLGNYAINVPGKTDTLVFTFIGSVKQQIAVKGKHIIDVVMLDDDNSLKEVVVVAYGQQKKESMVSSITAINPKELKGPTSNLTTMLAGRLAGLISYQRSGEPGADNASFFIRGVGTFGSGKIDPLILIDGMESTTNSLAQLQPDDIAGFSILKDAAASSLYGARGANGVILVTTKLGKSGDTKFDVRFENNLSSNTENFRLANNITYMNLANEAVLTRNPVAPLPYSQNKIDNTIAGNNSLLYPNNNWINLLIKPYTLDQRVNMNVTGGGKAAQYYISGTFNQDNGVLKTVDNSNFSNNIDLKHYQIRSNVTIKMTPTTDATVRTSGDIEDYNGPVGGGGAVFQSALNANPVLFPAVFPASALPGVHHPLFGNASLGTNGQTYSNPYASMVSGFQQYNSSVLNVQLELKQDLKGITQGLSASMMVYTQRYSYFALSRQYNPFYYAANPSATDAKGYTLSLLNEATATEYLNYAEGSKLVNTTTYGQAAINYNRTFGKNEVSGLLVGIEQDFLNGNAGDLQSSLPARNQGVSGRLTYGYDKRYLFETNFGYNGSEKFAANNRYGFFPSAGVAWNISNEKFFKPLSKVVTSLKLRATYGLVGNDQIGLASDRFFYLSNVNLADPNNAYTFGSNYANTKNGVSISRYANDQITWEKSRKANVGMDIGLLGDFNIIIDAYKEHRSNILMVRNTLPTTLGLTAPVEANVGAAESRGIEGSLDYNKSFGSSWLQLRGTFTYATSKLLVNEEPDYPANELYLSQVGQSLGQSYGLIAERLFIDDEDVKNSPKQAFGETRGGDIKYRDLNGDGQITAADMVPLGYPTTPEIIYGFGFSFGYKNFDISSFFQGSARSSFFIDPKAISPFILNGTGGQNGLLDAIAKDHWSEDNRNSYALWPRLSSTLNANDDQPSSWWLRDGSFLRLKTVEIGYSLKETALKKFHISSLRFYANGSNLFLISSFKLWDPEQGSNGLGYPIQKVFNLGVTIHF